MLEQIGGPVTCEHCGHWSDGSDIHICGEREKEIKASVENSPFASDEDSTEGEVEGKKG